MTQNQENIIGANIRQLRIAKDETQARTAVTCTSLVVALQITKQARVFRKTKSCKIFQIILK